MHPIRNIATVAAVAFALTAGTALANTNSPTVQSQRHWKGHAPTQPVATIGVFHRGHGVGVSSSQHKWR